jgi:DedD protein
MTDPKQIPDRRPVLFGLLAVLVLLAATALFWPSSDTPDSDTLVLTPESLQVNTESSPTEKATTKVTDEVGEADLAAEPLPEGEKEIVNAIPDDSKAQDTPSMRVEGTRAEPGTQTRSARPQPLPESAVPSSDREFVPKEDGDYVLNVGFFGDRDNAERMVLDLQKKGVAAHVRAATSHGHDGYRVRVGYFETSGQAAGYARQLKEDLGIDAWTSRR